MKWKSFTRVLIVSGYMLVGIATIYLPAGSVVAGTINDLGLALADIEVTGTVTSADDNNPLSGVSILIKGSSTGTVTDVNGKYALVVPEESTLVFSYVGFMTQSGERTLYRLKIRSCKLNFIKNNLQMLLVWRQR